MRTVCLALNRFATPKDIHMYLKEMLSFPSYYGNNLDALYDVLSTYHEPLTLCIHCGHAAVTQNPQWQPFLRLLHDVSRENPRIKIID